MSPDEIIDWSRQYLSDDRVFVFPEDFFKTSNGDGADLLAEKFKHKYMVRLPQREIKFFDWLKSADPEVWDDLWMNETEKPYLVSMTFLPLLIDIMIGFPICDLLLTDNYYFTSKHFASSETDLMIESVKNRFIDRKDLSVAQQLLLQISITPVDIWHFAYYNKINLDLAKQAVKDLVNERLLIHIKEADKLANFIEF